MSDVAVVSGVATKYYLAKESGLKEVKLKGYDVTIYVIVEEM